MSSSAPAPPLVVALETSTRSPSVAVQRGAERRERSLSRERAHASDLVPALAELLRELDAAPREIDVVVVGRGPGSYTGLRVGLATALGLARGAGARALALPSGEALAWAELAPGEEGCHLVDVRQGALAFAHHRRWPERVEVLAPPQLVARERARALVPATARVYADEGAARALEGAAELGARLVVGAVPRAAALLELAAARIAAPDASAPEELEPLYLREFRAVPRRR